MRALCLAPGFYRLSISILQAQKLKRSGKMYLISQHLMIHDLVMLLPIMKRIVPLSLCVLVLAGCARTFGIERGIKPEQQLDVEIKKEQCAIIRTPQCDIAVEPIDTRAWATLLKHNIFEKERKNPSSIRIPKLAFFHIIISNAGKSPLTVESVTLSYGPDRVQPLSVQKVIERCKSPAYGAFHFKRILTPLRLIGDMNCVRKINYERDVVSYRLRVINPGDRIIMIKAFEWIPVQYRELKIAVAIATVNNIQKTIDFNFKRVEYRTRGKFFRNPAKEKEEEED
jgi:hypothetical protein